LHQPFLHYRPGDDRDSVWMVLRWWHVCVGQAVAVKVEVVSVWGSRLIGHAEAVRVGHPSSTLAVRHHITSHSPPGDINAEASKFGNVLAACPALRSGGRPRLSPSTPACSRANIWYPSIAASAARCCDATHVPVWSSPSFPSTTQTKPVLNSFLL
jgi:hypothetical protein